MSKFIFITRKIPDVGIKLLKEKGYVVDTYPKDSVPSQRELISYLKKKPYDALICLLTDTIDAKIFDAAPTVKLYSNYATGFDNINLSEAKRRGITITNAPADLSSETVAEHTIALMLALTTRIVEANEFVKQGKYKGWSPMNFIGTNIFGKTLGLIGIGRIGSRVGYYAKSLGMNIIYTDVIRNEEIEKELDAKYYTSTDELLPQADVVSLHVPLLDSTRHLINKERLYKMKPSTFLINTSRGLIIDEKALKQALSKKIISGAALDVFEFEPKTVPGLTKLKNVILTPHISSASIETRNQMAKIAVQNVIDFFEGKIPQNVVNK